MRKEKRTPAGRETIPPDLAQRCLRIATYMLEHHATIRQAANLVIPAAKIQGFQYASPIVEE